MEEPFEEPKLASKVPPSFPPPPSPDFDHQARSRAKANTKLQKSLASKECALCWPLGAAEIGVCICSDLALVNVQTAASSSAVERESVFPSPSTAQPASSSVIPSNAVATALFKLSNRQSKLDKRRIAQYVQSLKMSKWNRCQCKN